MIERTVRAFEARVQAIDEASLAIYGEAIPSAIDPRLVEQLRAWVIAMEQAANALSERPIEGSTCPPDDDSDLELLTLYGLALDRAQAPAPLRRWHDVSEWILSFCHCDNSVEPFASSLAYDPNLIGLVIAEAISWHTLSGVDIWPCLSHILNAATALRPDLRHELALLVEASDPWLASRARVALEVMAGAPSRRWETYGLEPKQVQADARNPVRELV